jgi:hypothetical protein
LTITISYMYPTLKKEQKVFLNMRGVNNFRYPLHIIEGPHMRPSLFSQAKY